MSSLNTLIAEIVYMNVLLEYIPDCSIIKYMSLNTWVKYSNRAVMQIQEFDNPFLMSLVMQTATSSPSACILQFEGL